MHNSVGENTDKIPRLVRAFFVLLTTKMRCSVCDLMSGVNVTTTITTATSKLLFPISEPKLMTKEHLNCACDASLNHKSVSSGAS